MGTFFLIIVAASIGLGTDSGPALKIHEIGSFSTKQACEVAGSLVASGLSISTVPQKGGYGGAVRISYVCIEKR